MSSPSHVSTPTLIPVPAEPSEHDELGPRLSLAPMGTLSGVSEPLLRPQWSTDGRWLSAACNGGTVAIWDMADLALGELSFFSIYARIIYSGAPAPAALTPVRVPTVGFAFSAGARILYVPVDGDEAASLIGEHDGPIVALAGNHQHVASLGADTVQIWDPLAASTPHARASFAVDRPGCRDLAWAADSDRIAVAGEGGVSIYDPTNPGTPVHIDIEDTVCCLAWSTRGNVLAAGTHGGDIHLWERDRPHPRRVLRGHLSPVSGVAFSSDETLLASTSASGEVLIWTVADGGKRCEIPEELGALGRTPATGLAFHPGANVLATIDSYDQLSVRLWSARPDEHRPRLAMPSEHDGAGGPGGEHLVPASEHERTPGIRWQHLSPLDTDGAGAGGSAPGFQWHDAPTVVEERQPRARTGTEPGHDLAAARPGSDRAAERIAHIWPQRAGWSSADADTAPAARPVDISAEALRTHVAAAGLLQGPRIYMQIAAALNAGKHVLLLGPPGTGKTTLARTVADFAARAGLCGAPLCTAASAGWTARDTIGGVGPHEPRRPDRPSGHDGFGHDRDDGAGFTPGLMLRAMSAGRWLIIDALDRVGADGEGVFGDLLTAMAGHPVELPYRVAGGPVRVLPHRGSARDFTGGLAGDPGAYVIHPNWRILATVNIAGQARPFPLSPVLMRHFAVIDVPPPEPTLFRQLVELWLDDADSALPTAVADTLARAMERLLSPDMPLMRRRPLGPAVIRDMIAYVVERARMSDDPGDVLLGEAFLAHGAAQLEGLGRDDLLAIHRHLTTSVFPGTAAARLLDARMRALHPEIPSGAWSDW